MIVRSVVPKHTAPMITINITGSIRMSVSGTREVISSVNRRTPDDHEDHRGFALRHLRQDEVTGRNDAVLGSPALRRHPPAQAMPSCPCERVTQGTHTARFEAAFE